MSGKNQKGSPQSAAGKQGNEATTLNGIILGDIFTGRGILARTLQSTPENERFIRGFF
jgi:hypothetical protein